MATFSLLVTGCNPSLASIACIDAKKYLVGIASSKQSFHTDTVPAIHAAPSGTFAVEFRGSNTSGIWWLRRIYNLVLGMWQSGTCQMDELRHGFLYLQIRKAGARDQSKYDQLGDADPVGGMSGMLDRLVDDPWEYDPKYYEDHKKYLPSEYCLTGLVCEKAYVLFDDEVEKFVGAKKWS